MFCSDAADGCHSLATVEPAFLESPVWNREPRGSARGMNFILWLIAVVLVIVGIVLLFTGNIIAGIVLIIVGLLVGPGGYSIFRGRGRRTTY
jgi:Protein of unknown function (DUF3040)